MPPALLALALSAFAIGTTEFVTNGLLTELAADFDVTVAQAGLVTTAYAVGQACGPVLALLTLRMRSRRLLVLLMLLFTVGNLASALAPGFGPLLAARFLTACTHTAFFGAASVVASRLVPAARQGAAIALVFTGLSLANVLGLPIGTLAGQAWGWRGAFVLVAVLGAGGLLGLLLLLPRSSAESSGGIALRAELAVFADLRLWLALAATAIGFGGLFASFTFVQPMLTEVTGFGTGDVVWLLAVYGAGLVAGNWTAGRAADRALVPTTAALLAALTLALALFSVTVHHRGAAVATLFLLGFCGFGLLTPTQAYVLRVAGRESALVGTANTAAFGAGITLGSLLGAAVIERGGSYPATNLAGAAMTALGLLVFGLSVAAGRRRRTDSPSASGH
ncbi:MFS transporter [Streptomyces sp. FH025]|uniref:MFS transporter n=1 Tax=Streptomyces sp. FH025 TaxID=2815937 RepID=UPI001A9F093E|nr:MFS transporter [Streptomyces sp. FH025]MBO1417985.1 MFS transporter [Streptomyces sp. FH025]